MDNDQRGQLEALHCLPICILNSGVEVIPIHISQLNPDWSDLVRVCSVRLREQDFPPAPKGDGVFLLWYHECLPHGGQPRPHIAGERGGRGWDVGLCNNRVWID